MCSQVTYSLRRLTALQTQNLYIGPRPESELSHAPAPDLKSLYPGAEAKPDPIKGGLRVTSFFTYNCLAVSLDGNIMKYLGFYTYKKNETNTSESPGGQTSSLERSELTSSVDISHKL